MPTRTAHRNGPGQQPARVEPRATRRAYRQATSEGQRVGSGDGQSVALKKMIPRSGTPPSSAERSTPSTIPPAMSTASAAVESTDIVSKMAVCAASDTPSTTMKNTIQPESHPGSTLMALFYPYMSSFSATPHTVAARRLPSTRA